MEVQYSASWPFFFLRLPENHVRWSETPESHLFSADLPGVRKEEIRVEVEDSCYLIIRTELERQIGAESEARAFSRKFRLPERVQVEGISASYEDGVLTVMVPKLVAACGLRRIQPVDDAQSHREIVARAA